MADAGWYPDPGDPHVTRYWDGASWRAQRRWDGTAWVQTAIAATPARVVEPPPAPAPAPAPTATPAPAPAPAPTPAPATSGVSPLVPPREGAAPIAAGGRPTDRRKLAMISGAVAAVVILVIVGVAVRGGGGGGGTDAFCNDQRIEESALLEVQTLTTSNPARWTSSEKASVQKVGESLRAQASDAPAKVKADSHRIAALWAKFEQGDWSRTSSTDFNAAGDRVKAYSAEACHR